jgi:hypothetical protein
MGKCNESSGIGKEGGQSDNVKSTFLKSLMVAVALAPEVIKNNQPLLRKHALLLGLGVSHGWRYLSEVTQKWKKIEDFEEYFLTTKKVKCWSGYNAEYRDSIREWVRNHQFVRVSPITTDMLQTSQWA